MVSSTEIGQSRSLGRTRFALVSFGLVLAVIAVYHAAPTHDFINYDDPQYVTRSEITQQGITFHGIAWAFSDVSTGNWHPLTRLSHMLDCALFGLSAGAHHSVNVFIHILNTLLLLFTLNRMTGALWRSAFVAALFALHPLHVESVAWISERKDVLSGFFWIAAMYAYAVYSERISVFRYAVVALFMALGLMSKPMVVTLPAALLLLDIWPLQRLTAPIGATRAFAKCLGQLFLEKVPLFALGIGAGVLTLALQQHALNQAEQLSFALRAQNAMAAYGIYLKQTVWPVNLAIFYPHPLENLRTSAWFSGAAVLVVCSIVACAMLKRAPYVFVGWWWFVGTLLPVIGIVQVGLQGWADRYTYLPHIGLFVALVWAGGDAFAKVRIPSKIVGAASAAVLVGLGFVSAHQHSYWKNTVTVFEHALDVTENNKLAHLILVTAYAKRGDLDTAESHVYAAIQIEGDAAWTENMPEGHFALGLLADRQGDWDVAVAQYAKAIELDEKFSEAHNNLAGVYMELGQRGAPELFLQARIHAVRALELKPENAEAAANAAFLALHFKDYEAAVRLHELALPHFPNHAAMHRNMGLALFGAGDLERALVYARRAFAMDPGFVEARGDIARYEAALGVN